jgi:hypothetical protein
MHPLKIVDESNKRIYITLWPSNILSFDAAALLGARPLSQDLLLLIPKNSKVFLFPYREICTPQILLSATPLFSLVGKSELTASRVFC